MLLCFLGAIFTPVTRIRQALRDKKKPKTLENYTLTLSDESIPRVGLILQADGKAQDCYFLDAPYAFRLADELTMAAARAAPKSASVAETGARQQQIAMSQQAMTGAGNFDNLKA